jgi:SAM-dependent methyltransferase
MVYDQLMNDVPYPKWVDLVQTVTQKMVGSNRRLLDIGCGTGTLPIMLSQIGYQVTGIDLSEEMLAIAQQKAQSLGHSISFFQMDMTNLEEMETFDLITIFCDSINYLSTPLDVQKTFQGVYDLLDEKGYFLFDTHSIYKIEHVFMNQSYSFISDDVSYIWNCFPGEFPNSVDHELTFFIEEEQTGKYERFDENHTQRAFSTEEYKKWLTDAGFQIESIHADFNEQDEYSEGERLFFICKK